MHLSYSPAFILEHVDHVMFDKLKVLASLVEAEAVPGAVLVAPEPATKQDVLRLHDADYVEAVFTGEPWELASSNGFPWDPALVPSVLASLGGGQAAARVAWRDGVAGSLFSGEHHGHPGAGSGYCTFNGPAMTALTFADAGARRVLVVDLDAHCGGGTAAILRRDERFRQVDVAVDRFDSYDSTELFPLRFVTEADRYLDTIEEALAGVPAGWPDAVVYVAGMDPHELDGHAGLNGISDLMLRVRERMIFEWMHDLGVPFAFCVAGGYGSFRTTLKAVARLHLLTLQEAARVNGLR